MKPSSAQGRNAYDQIVGVLMMTFAMCLMSSAIGFARSDLRAMTSPGPSQMAQSQQPAKPAQSEEEVRKENATRLLVSAYFYLSFFSVFAGVGVMLGAKWGFISGLLVGLVGLGIGALGSSVTGYGAPLGMVSFALSAAYCTARAFGKMNTATPA